MLHDCNTTAYFGPLRAVQLRTRAGAPPSRSAPTFRMPRRPSSPSCAAAVRAPAVRAPAARGYTVAAALSSAAACASCSALHPATPEQRVAERLRNTVWEGADPLASGPVTVDRILAAGRRARHAGERVEFRDSTVTFTRDGSGFESIYAVADSTHLRLRTGNAATGAVGVQTVLVSITNGDTLRMLPSPFPPRGGTFGRPDPVGEWVRRPAR